ARHGLPGLRAAAPAAKLLTRPGARYAHLLELGLGRAGLPPRVIEQVEIEIRYAGYIRRQQEEVERMVALERRRIPAGLDYQDVHGLTNEAAGRLREVQPVTIAQASRVQGVNPADISVLLIHLKKLGVLG
ncbi:tRNA uridine-5-carboxymethylaminomethyl(34) synthesis enzyme MnmG, partial [Candidatus Sumerlaeota bacterium]